MPDINMHLKMVKHFHQKYNCEVGVTPPFKDETLYLRRRLITEEYNELMDVFQDILCGDKSEEAMAHLIKEAIDLNYVVLGLFVALGIPHNEAFAAVHGSNMSKLGPKVNGKVVKGATYKPADMLPIAKKVLNREKNLHPTP